MTYKFKFKRRLRLFYRTRVVVGHRYEQSFDKMVLYFPDGGIEELCNWKDCDLKLGPDWLLMAQKKMEEQAGQPIPVNRG